MIYFQRIFPKINKINFFLNKKFTFLKNFFILYFSHISQTYIFSKKKILEEKFQFVDF